MTRRVLLLTLATAVALWLLPPVQAAGRRTQVAFVPKLIGIPYFNAMEKGGKQAAADLNVEFVYTGPTTADSAAQIQIVDNLITRGVPAIAVAPNDPTAIAPTLKKGKDRGLKMFTSDTDAPNSVREVFVNQALAEDIGNTSMDEIGRAHV